MDCREKNQDGTISETMAAEDRITEKTDEKGNRWRKAYVGGGKHFENWLAQCRELGEVMVEEIASTGYKCFETTGEKLYRIWVKMDDTRHDDLF